MKEVKEFEESFLAEMARQHPDALKDLKSGKLSKEAIAAMEGLAKEMTARFS